MDKKLIIEKARARIRERELEIINNNGKIEIGFPRGTTLDYDLGKLVGYIWCLLENKIITIDDLK